MKRVDKGLQELGLEMVIEVVMRKQMTLSEYHKVLISGKNKGWQVQGYELGYSSEGLGKKYLK